MPTVSELMLMSGASESTLWFLRGYGLQFDDDDFEIDKNHTKAINDLRKRRLSPYVLAYAWRCRENGSQDDFARFDNMVAIAKIRGFSISEAFLDIRAKHIANDLLPTAKYWIDRAITKEHDADALQRVALWCKEILKTAPPFELDHTYLAVRLLASLPSEEMYDYPRLVQRALNKAIHYGFLDGWCRKVSNDAGKNTMRYFRAKYDL